MYLAAALTAQFYYLTCIAIFCARLLTAPGVERVLGYAQLLALAPLVVLVIQIPRMEHPVLSAIQLGLMVAFIIVETLLDLVLRVDFRGDLRIVIPYVVLFFAATGGMLGLAAQAGTGWKISSVVLFLAMAALAFVQRARTGM
jgi:hypothetical protein